MQSRFRNLTTVLVLVATCSVPLLSADWLPAVLPLCIITLLLVNLDPLLAVIYQTGEEENFHPRAQERPVVSAKGKR